MYRKVYGRKSASIGSHPKGTLTDTLHRFRNYPRIYTFVGLELINAGNTMRPMETESDEEDMGSGLPLHDHPGHLNAWKDGQVAPPTHPPACL